MTWWLRKQRNVDAKGTMRHYWLLTDGRQSISLGRAERGPPRLSEDDVERLRVERGLSREELRRVAGLRLQDRPAELEKERRDHLREREIGIRRGFCDLFNEPLEILSARVEDREARARLEGQMREVREAIVAVIRAYEAWWRVREEEVGKAPEHYRLRKRAWDKARRGARTARETLERERELERRDRLYRAHRELAHAIGALNDVPTLLLRRSASLTEHGRLNYRVDRLQPETAMSAPLREFAFTVGVELERFKAWLEAHQERRRLPVGTCAVCERLIPLQRIDTLYCGNACKQRAAYQRRS